MISKPFSKLLAGSAAANFADQITLAVLPLLLAASGSGAAAISIAVAAQSAAWLFISLPIGAFTDTLPRRSIMSAGLWLVLLSAFGAAGLLQAGLAQPWALSAAAFCLGAGVVMVMLAVFALVPGAVERQRLSRANALLEFCRAIVCIAAPLIAAQFAARGLGALAFALAGAAAIGGLLAVRALPPKAPRAAAKTRFLEAIREGAVFVAKQPVLRAIALCAIAWNAAFFALTAVFVPHAVKLLQLNTESIGAAWSVYGAGLLGGAIAAPFMIGRLHTGAVFAFGPLLSVFSALLLLTAAAPGRLCPVYMAFFCIGFGPMTWLVLQTSVRQIVTPPELMGRVGATISTAIYGVRPLGALLAGAVAAQFGTGAAIACAAGLFALSALAILLAPATRAISLRR